MPDSAQINRSLSTIKTELEFLQASHVLSPPQFQSIMAQLPVCTPLSPPLTTPPAPPSPFQATLTRGRAKMACNPSTSTRASRTRSSSSIPANWPSRRRIRAMLRIRRTLTSVSLPDFSPLLSSPLVSRARPLLLECHVVRGIRGRGVPTWTIERESLIGISSRAEPLCCEGSLV